MSVTAADGFVAAGGAIGIKGAGAADLALVATAEGRAVPAAGVFTANRATAAPVQVSKRHLAASGGRAAAVVLTSGNANAATGPAGVAAAEELCALAAVDLGAVATEILVCQTGLIGVRFPIEAVADAVPGVFAGRAASVAAGHAAACAIMTTDTVAKEATAVGETVSGGSFMVGGMAKGAAMLAPNMATMLAVVTTDAVLDPATLAGALSAAVASSFNELSVDGCTSTNDTVLVLASGLAGEAAPGAFDAALGEVCASLAAQMAADAEGATKVVTVTVTGAESDADARRAARRVADSLLVKCSLNGEDPYWGRVLSELGSAGVAFDPDRAAIAYGADVVCRDGVAAAHDERAVAEHLSGRNVEITCDLALGRGSASVLGTDLGYGYLDENRTTS